MEGEIITKAVPVIDADGEKSAFNKVFNNEEEDQEPETLTAEEPPEEKIENPWDKEIVELRTQVARIPELEKRLRDAGGQYGGLKQTVEQIQKRLSSPTEFLDAKVDASELLKDLNGAGYEELAEMLKPAFSKIMTATPSEESIAERVTTKLNEEKIAAQKKSLEDAMEAVTEAHSDFKEIINKEEGKFTDPVFAEWLESLTPRKKAKAISSTDPDYVSDVIDEFKEYRASKKQQVTKPNDRLERAVQPDGASSVQQRTKPASEADAFNAVFNKKKR